MGEVLNRVTSSLSPERGSPTHVGSIAELMLRELVHISRQDFFPAYVACSPFGVGKIMQEVSVLMRAGYSYIGVIRGSTATVYRDKKIRK